jgi:hypothetical protein
MRPFAERLAAKLNSRDYTETTRKAAARIVELMPRLTETARKVQEEAVLRILGIADLADAEWEMDFTRSFIEQYLLESKAPIPKDEG